MLPRRSKSSTIFLCAAIAVGLLMSFASLLGLSNELEYDQHTENQAPQEGALLSPCSETMYFTSLSVKLACPPDWIAKVVESSPPKIQFQRKGAQNATYYPVYVQFRSKSETQTLREFYDSICTRDAACSNNDNLFLSAESYENISVGRLPAIRFAHVSGPVPITVTALAYKGRIVEIVRHEFAEPTEEAEIFQVYNQLVRSLEFLE